MAFSDSSLQASWRLALSSLDSHVVTMSSSCQLPFRDLLPPSARRVSAGTPTSQEQLNSLRKEQTNASRLIGLVCHAATMAQSNPAAAQGLYGIAKRTSELTPLSLYRGWAGAARVMDA